jgi:heptosyltransferase I
MNQSEPFSILIIKTSSIGDVIQSFPALEYLRRKYPDARIDWVVEQGIAPLLKAHPLLDQVLEIRTKAWRKGPFSLETRNECSTFARKLRSKKYDLLFDLQGNTKSAVITGLAKAEVKVGFDWKSVREKSNLLVTNKRLCAPTNLNIRLKYLGLVQRYFHDLEEFKAEGVRLQLTQPERERLRQICENPQVRLMVCFGSKWANKRLDNSTLSSLLQEIAKTYPLSFLFIYGDEIEKGIAESLAAPFGENGAVLGNLSLPLWQAIMWEVKGVIAVDSAALHLCGTTQTPSFSVFGPSLASSYKPIEDRHLAVQGACPYGRTFSKHCPILRTCATGACIRELNAEDLFSSFKNWADVHLADRASFVVAKEV